MRELDIDQYIWQEWFQEGYELGYKLGYELGYELGFKQGLEPKAQEIARKMLIKGIAIALIVDFTGLTLEQVQQLQAQQHNQPE